MIDISLLKSSPSIIMVRNLLSSRSSCESELNETSTAAAMNSDGELVHSARALLREHSQRMDSNNSLDVANGLSTMSSPFSVEHQDSLKSGDRKSDKSSATKKKSGKESHPKKQREVVMSYKINCVSDISAILCTVEVDLKVSSAITKILYCHMADIT